MTEIIIAFLTLSLLEILLGIDNLVILSIIIGRLPDARSQRIARRVGLLLALVLRISFLFAITWIIKMDQPFFSLFGHPLSIRDLILLFGGGFLMYRGVKEIHEMFAENKYQSKTQQLSEQMKNKVMKKQPSLFAIILEIAFLDVLFALDSIITAIALSDHLGVMIAANVFAVFLMMAIVNWISTFLDQNPAFKVLAVCFLLLVGFTLVSDGFGFHIPKGYLYFGIGFALFIEILNTILRKEPKETKNTPSKPE